MAHMHSVQLPDDLSARLTNLAKLTKRTKSHFLREALERTLEDLEDAYLAETAHEAFLKSGEAAIPLEEVEKRLGLEN
jgi:RHH-type rel operon transcriptional repressor/antitoxin RelB